MLTVTNPFGNYQKGDQITDPAEIKKILAGENAGHVVRTQTKSKE